MIAGRYTLDREIGRGGMGAVWLGRDEVLGRSVALKRIGMMPGGSSPDLERAEREARLAARLNHPHVVAVFDLVNDEDQQWLVMEYVEGVTLAELVRRDGALTPEQASPLIAQAADALAAAHEAGIVHRDVKPSNILVTPQGQVKLSDFGIARAQADASLTQTGLVTGSPAYLAPEVASGQTANGASDVWSLGATLFHALAGHPPYDVGDNLMGALYRIVHEDPPRLEGAGWLAPLLEATMTREPAERWSMAQVRDFLAAGPAGTVLTPVPTNSVPGADPTRTQVLSATTAAPAPVAPAPPVPARRRPARALPVLVGLAVLLVAGLVAWAALSGGDGGSQTQSPPAGGGSASSHTPSPSTSPSPSESPSSSTGATPDGMETFIQDYLATVTSDQKASWEMLTPKFQDESGGFGKYKGFWKTIESARPTTIQADPDTLQVRYGVDYVRKDRSRVSDTVTLQLVYDAANDSYLIDGEA
ncbi:serine/threonine protein kinase [Nocardioides ginsengisegetis]|uniref:non-specific serine/threonine protein kinase n=1 Tax=Nocardioides ginsengisegetis TaxID=661491 RepID=A0A7W3IWL3_9ACTN|nr:serine/threonine protein kinase [Nocardioides ginsengisegetis]